MPHYLDKRSPHATRNYSEPGVLFNFLVDNLASAATLLAALKSANQSFRIFA